MTPENFQRLEDKVDTLTDAITRLVLFEERQSVQAVTLASLQANHTANVERLQALEGLVNRWINRGIGAWAVAAIVGSAIFTLAMKGAFG